MYMHQVSAGRERRRAEAALLDDRYLGPSLYGFQLAAFLDHFDRSQVLVIANEVLRDRPRDRLTSATRLASLIPASDVLTWPWPGGLRPGLACWPEPAGEGTG